MSIYLEKLQTIFNSLDQSQSIEEYSNSTDSTLITSFSTLNANQQFNFDPFEYQKARLDLAKKNNGINFTIDGLQNIDPNQADLEDNILYQRRYQAGIEWNILKNGYFDSKENIKKIDVEEKIEAEILKLETNKKNIPIKMNQCIFWFNVNKNNILNQRQHILEQQSEIINKLYFSKKINREFIIKNQTRLLEIKAMKGIYESYNQHLAFEFDSSFYEFESPLFDLNYDLFLGDYAISTVNDSTLFSLIENFEGTNKWYNEINLKTYSRFNYYDLISLNPGSRSFVSIGLGANIPLQFKHKEQNTLDYLKLKKQFVTLEETATNKRIDLLNEAYEFRYQLKQYIVFHQKKILLNESIRQERVKGKLLDADFNPLHALELVDDLLQVEIELLDLKQNLYIKLLKIHDKMSPMMIHEIIKPISLPNFFKFDEKSKSTIYVWSKTFELHPTDFLVEYCAYNRFEEVHLAVNKNDKYKEEKIKFINALHEKGIKVNLMIGHNSLLDSANPSSEIEESISEFKSLKIKGIHLDIEPHVREQWKSNKVEEQKKYLNIIKETKKLCSKNHLTFSVDLPLILDSLFVKEILSEVDNIRFMSYENIKEDYIIRKIKPYLVQKEKISISLRTEDFLSRSLMESFAQKIGEALEINTINYHDLNRLIEFDKQNLKQYEEH